MALPTKKPAQQPHPYPSLHHAYEHVWDRREIEFGALFASL